MSPRLRLTLARGFRPVVLMFVPVAVALLAFGASFQLIAAWLLLIGLIGFAAACPRCRQSNYWDEARPDRTLLARPHAVCTRCGFDFEAEA